MLDVHGESAYAVRMNASKNAIKHKVVIQRSALKGPVVKYVDETRGALGRCLDKRTRASICNQYFRSCNGQLHTIISLNTYMHKHLPQNVARQNYHTQRDINNSINHNKQAHLARNETSTSADNFSMRTATYRTSFLFIPDRSSWGFG